MKTLLVIISFCMTTLFALGAEADRIVAKRRAFLDSIVFPKVNFQKNDLQECRDFVWGRTFELDDKEVDLSKKGVTILIPHDLVQFKKMHVPEINYRANSITLTNLLIEIARQSNLDVYTTSVGVVFCLPGKSPFPNAKASKGEMWETIYRVPQKPQRKIKEGEQAMDVNRP